MSGGCRCIARGDLDLSKGLRGVGADAEYQVRRARNASIGDRLLIRVAQRSLDLGILHLMLRIITPSDPLAIHQDGRARAEHRTCNAGGGNAITATLVIYGDFEAALSEKPGGDGKETYRGNFSDT